MDQINLKNGWHKRELLQEAKLIMKYYIEGVPMISIYNRDLFNNKGLYYGQVEYMTPEDRGSIVIYRTSKMFEDDLELLKFKCLVIANELGWDINLFSYKES